MLPGLVVLSVDEIGVSTRTVARLVLAELRISLNELH